MEHRIQYDHGTYDSGAAIIGSHVLSGGLPILYAKRDEPLDEIDSGWQFVCNSGPVETEGHVCSIREIILMEPTLVGMLSMPPGTILFGESLDSEWKYDEFDPAEEKVSRT